MTTTKELNANVFSYILDAIDGSGYDKELTTDKEKLTFLAECFKSEFVYQDNLKRYGNYQNMFKEWIQGLPSSFGIDFYNSDIIRIAKEWNSLPANPTSRQEDKIIENWFHFIASKTFQLMKRHKVLPH